LKFNLAASLHALCRDDEAAALLPAIRELTDRLDQATDRLRLRWLEGKIAAGQGRSEKAIAALEEVQAGFVAAANAYDAALVALELAALLAEQGETARVKTLARQTAEIFRAQAVAREALMAIQLFVQAAEREALTAELARELAERIEQARGAG
jgi:hypothetical protein